MRFSGAPSLGPDVIVSVSPLATSFTMPLIQPELGRPEAILELKDYEESF